MIKNLSIRNIGGISEASLKFTEGLNVITGESGTGKTSIVRALELLTGTKGSVKYIRSGETKGTAEAEINGKIITREQLSSGRTKAKINGKTAKINEISDFVKRLIRIQSQFSQIELLKPEKQLEILDSCLSEEIKFKTLKEYYETYEKTKSSKTELEATKKRRTEIEKRYGNANEIFELVKRVKPETNLEIKLENALSDVIYRISLKERAKESYDILTGGLSGEGLIRNVKRNFEELYEFLSEEEIDKIKSSFENLYDVLEVTDIKNTDKEESERKNLQDRLGGLRKLKRLCRISDENELLKYCDEIYKDLEWFNGSHKDLEEKIKIYKNYKNTAGNLAKILHEGRSMAAEILQKRVNDVLKELDMNGMSFEIKFNTSEELKPNGIDEIIFEFNDGKRNGKVNEIASGGELSRLLLALQISLPDEWLADTIVFDEIEAGLGGHAAILSGHQLKKLSQRCQVILITHEASIAALGNTHIMIERLNGETIMRNIDGEERVKEIARMLSGSPDMKEAHQHAKRLLPEN